MQQVLSLALLLLPAMVPAQEPVEERTEVLGLRQWSLTRGPVTILDRPRIERLGAWSAPELLRHAPGLDVVRSGGLAGQTSLFLRGGNSQHTLVLIDGVRVNDPISGLADLSLLPADEIERIEVARGPQGLAHGADAMAGVIRIYTRRSHRPGLSAELDAAGGGYRSQRQAARIVAAGAASVLDLRLSRRRAGGFSIATSTPGVPAEDDGYRAVAANLRLSHRPESAARWELGLRHQSNRQDVEGFTSVPVDDPDYRQWDRTWQGYALVSAVPYPGWKHQLRLGFFSLHRVARNGPLVSTCCSSDRRGSHMELSWMHDWQDRASLGLEVRREQNRDRQSALRRSLRRGSAWLEMKYGAASAGLRHEQHDAYGGHSAWRIGLHGAPGDSWRLRGQVGTARRTPGITELYGDFGNPGLRPERSLGWDLGVAYQAAAGRMELSLYRQYYRELLGFDSNFRLRNIGRALSQGVELSLAGNLRQMLDLQFDYTYSQARNRVSGRPLARRPRHKFSATATTSWPERGLDTTLALRYTGPRLDSDFSGHMLPSYTVADAGLNWRAWPGVQLRLRVENLGGHTYQEVAGYNAPGRTFYTGIRYTPGVR